MAIKINRQSGIKIDPKEAAAFIASIKQTLIKRLSYEIQAREWTQTEAAEAMGIPQPRISEIVRGHDEKFSIDILLSYLQTLGVKFDLNLDDKEVSLEDICNRLLEQGMSHLAKSSVRDAIESFKEALAVAQRIGRIEALGDCYYLLAGALAAANDNPSAIASFVSAKEIYEELNKKSKTYLALKTLGMANIHSEKWTEAITYLQQAADIASSENSGSIDPAECLVLIGELHERLGDWPSSERIAKRLLSLAIKRQDSKRLPLIYKILADSCKKQGKLMEADRYEEESKKGVNTKTFLPPHGWGVDDISKFIDVVQQNFYATFVNQSDYHAQIVDIDERFRSKRILMRDRLLVPEVKKQHNTIGYFNSIKLNPEDWLEVYFFMSAHSSFLGATTVAFSAQLPEAYMLMRGCLENSLYGLLVFSRPDLKKVWLDRELNESTRKECRKQFTSETLFKALRTNDSGLADRARSLYDITIDRGAHPNIESFRQNSIQTNQNGELVLATAYLNPGQLEPCLSHLIDVGTCMLRIVDLVIL